MDVRGVPPLAVRYHFILVPVATRLATVGALIRQNICGEVPVGASGLATVTETARRRADSHEPTV